MVMPASAVARPAGRTITVTFRPSVEMLPRVVGSCPRPRTLSVSDSDGWGHSTHATSLADT
eukprot:2433096-Rhodomonas_salina.2